MPNDTTTAIWLGLAVLSGLAASLSFHEGTPVLPLVLCGLALICALHRPSREFVMEQAGKAFSGSTLRLALIVVGAMLIWQLVGIELALLMAGDVLAYVEVVGAVNLIAANTRLAPLKAALRRRLDGLRRAARPDPRGRSGPAGARPRPLAMATRRRSGPSPERSGTTPDPP